MFDHDAIGRHRSYAGEYVNRLHTGLILVIFEHRWFHNSYFCLLAGDQF